MNGQLLTVVAGYLSLVAVLAMLAAAGVPCGPAVRAGLIVAELLLVVQALVAGMSLLGGHRPEEPATHLGYLAVSVVLLPLLLGRPSRVARPSRPDLVVAALATAVAVVVSVRLHATWRG